MQRLQRYLKRLWLSLGALLLLLCLALVAGYLWLRTSLPQVEGHVAVAGTGQAVELLRDDDGILTIRAASETDAAFGLGFAHAQDRLGQMVLIRAMGQGRLSELAGRGTLNLDRAMRTLGLARIAAATLPNLDPSSQDLLAAYAAGINAYLTSHEGALPPVLEVAHRLFGYEIEPWHARDSVLWGKMMALRLSDNWRDELQLGRLAKRLTPAQLADLFPDLPPGSPVTLPGGEQAALTASTILAALPALLRSHGASNAWVLSGDLTTTGGPLLASDPHLPLQAPATWYLARIETPWGVRAGVTAPGAPVVLLGHNGHVAWGMTTTHGDSQDLVIERPQLERPDHYETPDGPRPFQLREETIQLRGGGSETLVVRATRHGPIVSDLARRGQARVETGGDLLAMMWPGFATDDRSSDALIRLNYARDLEQTIAALALLESPMQNVFFADTGGGIGYYTAGKVPLRAGYDGSRPVPGWNVEALWQGFVPFAEMPHAIDPEIGRMASANNRVVGPDYPHLISTRWEPPYRAERIEALLAARERHDIEGTAALQLDEVSLAARALLPLLLAAEPAPGAASDAHALLSRWDGDMDRNRREPLLFHAWVHSLNEILFADELGELFAEVARWNPLRLQRVLSQAPQWCEGPETADCAAALRLSLERALVLVEELSGSDDPAQQLWGRVHRARLAHPVLTRVPVINRLVDVVIEAGGGNYTINRATPGARRGDRLFEMVHGPELRAIYDLADLDNSRFMIASGQSGNIFSPLYDNLTDDWRDGLYLRLAEPLEETSRRLTLVPK